MLERPEQRRELQLLAPARRQSVSAGVDQQRQPEQTEVGKRGGEGETHSVVARKSSRYMRACGLKLIVSMYSYAPLMRSGSASPRSVFSAEITAAM